MQLMKILFAGMTFAATTQGLPTNQKFQDVFCEIVADHRKGVIIDENELVLAIEKPRMQNVEFRPNIDCLIITKEHIVQLNPKNPEHQKIKAAMDRMLTQLKNNMECPNDVETNINVPPNQDIRHVHMHVKAPCKWKNPYWR